MPRREFARKTAGRFLSSKGDLLFAVGMGAFYGWFDGAVIGSILYQPLGKSASTDMVSGFVVLLLGAALILVAAKPTFASSLLFHAGMPVVACAVGTLGTLASIAYANTLNPILLACVVSLGGAYSAIMLLTWGKHLIEHGVRNVLLRIFPTVFVGAFANIVILSLPGSVGSCAILLMPLVSCVCYRQFCRNVLGGSSASDELAELRAPSPAFCEAKQHAAQGTFKFFSFAEGAVDPKLLLGLGALTFIASFTHQVSLSFDNATAENAALLIYVARAAIGLAFYVGRMHLEKALQKKQIVLAAAIVLDAGFLILPLLNLAPGLGSIALVLTTVALVGFDVLIWVVLAQYFANNGSLSMRSIALGLFCSYFSFGLGFLFGMFITESGLPFGVLIAVCQVLSIAFSISFLALFSYLNTFFKKHDEAASAHVLEDDSKTIADLLVVRYGLTKREQEVVVKLAQRKSYKEISQELFVSENTIKTHVSRIYAKLGVHSRKEISIIFEAMRRELPADPPVQQG